MSATFYLNFHGLGDPHAGVDSGERPYWLSLDRFTEILAIAAKHRDGLGITFDDGNISDLHAAVPALRAAGFQADFLFRQTGSARRSTSTPPISARLWTRAWAWVRMAWRTCVGRI